MKIAVVSDIHGNIFAWNKTLWDIRKSNIDQIYVLGDMIGYYPYPVEVLDSVVACNAVCIRGNHERMLESVLGGQQPIEEIDFRYGHGLHVALDTLTERQLDWLVHLPDCLEQKIDNMMIAFCHGTYDDKDAYLYPDSSRQEFQQHSAWGFDFIFMGHTHYPFVFCGRPTLINVGSIGQARDYGGMASWCEYNTANGAIVFHHTRYDTKELIAKIKELDPDVPYLCEVLERGTKDAFS